MFLVKYGLGMVGIAICVLGTMRAQPDCRAACGPLAAAHWDPGEILPGIGTLITGLVALALPPAGAAQPPPDGHATPAAGSPTASPAPSGG